MQFKTLTALGGRGGEVAAVRAECTRISGQLIAKKRPAGEAGLFTEAKNQARPDYSFSKRWWLVRPLASVTST